MLTERAEQMGYLLITPHMVLRELRRDDADGLIHLCNDASALKWFPELNMAIRRADQFISLSQEGYASVTRDVCHLHEAICFKGSNELVGLINVDTNPRVSDQVAMQVMLLQEHCGKGYVTEVVKTMLYQLFHRLQIQSVAALVMEGNIAGCRLAEKCGFALCKNIFLPEQETGSLVEYHYYRITS